MGLALVMDLKSYTGVTKGSKAKFRKFWELIFMFVEVTAGKLVGGGVASLTPIMLNRFYF